LERLGYSVITAATPKEAIELVEENSSKIDLFITDVVMPEMNGRELADRIQKIRPGMKHLFMSGYTADIIVQQGGLDEGINFIQKPFLMEGLSKKIREILD
ncbi:MAG: response regulator, partial [Deltaproteobacteria bacterium]|nr:response regulator [Deltaproteobacteria bacterium]